MLYGIGGGWGPANQAGRTARSYVHGVESGGTSVVLDSPPRRRPHRGHGPRARWSSARAPGATCTSARSSSTRRPTPRSATTSSRAPTQGETRSHGFFYKPSGDDTGILALPIRGGHDPGYDHLVRDSASILYLDRDGDAFEALGRLGARPTGQEDGCRVSCVDWYGNARPLFLRGRVFALLGYELVEGRVQDGAITEVSRVDYIQALRQTQQLTR